MHMQLKKIIKRLMRILGQGLFPHRCCNCDRLYVSAADYAQNKKGPSQQLSGFLCTDCIPLLDPITSPLCVICGRSFQTDHGVDHMCSRCETTAYEFDAARAALGYSAAIRRIIHQYKYQGCTQLAKPLGAMLWETFISSWDPDMIDVVIPVPLHRSRLRRRGFNQSEQLLRNWPKMAGADCFRILPEVLIRSRATKPQTGLDADARKANLHNAFRLREAAAVKSKHVLLVDDVLTTGATVNACAKVLKRAGAASVKVATIAKT